MFIIFIIIVHPRFIAFEGTFFFIAVVIGIDQEPIIIIIAAVGLDYALPRRLLCLHPGCYCFFFTPHECMYPVLVKRKKNKQTKDHSIKEKEWKRENRPPLVLFTPRFGIHFQMLPSPFDDV